MRPGFGTRPVIMLAQPVARARTLEAEAREAGQVENAGGIAHGQAFLAHALLPRAVRGAKVWVASSEVSSPGCAYQVARSQPL